MFSKKMNKYALEFEVTNGGIIVKHVNRQYAFVGKLINFQNPNEVRVLINAGHESVSVGSSVEFVAAVDFFIRITQEEVQFGQYIDENLAQLESFKDYLDEGEKILGSIPTEEFVDLAKQWLMFLEDPIVIAKEKQIDDDLLSASRGRS